MQFQKGKRRYYLNDVPLDEALDKFLRALEAAGAMSPMAGEMMPLDRAKSCANL